MTAASVLPRRWRLPHRSVWLTPEVIYGTVLSCAILAAAEGDVTDRELVVTVVSTSMALWVAHSFAMVMARHGKHDGRETTLPQAIAHSARHSAGLLFGPAPTIAALALGAGNVISDPLAYWLAVALGILVIVTVGVVACVERGKSWFVCALAGLATGAVGLIIITLSAAFES